MKRSLLAVLLIILTFNFSQVFSQVGIGTLSPNQKAVLELKSPGNNQGFLVPRLTTVERTGMTGMSASEKGLLVFDSDIGKFYYWSGSVWIIIEDSTGTDSQTLSFNPTTGLLSITGGNGINLGGITPGGSAGGDLTGTYPSPTVAANAITSAKISDGTIVTGDLADGSVTTAKVVDGTITNVDINAAASIAVTKFAAGTNGQVLLTSGTTPTWSNMPPPSGAAGGDLTGTYPNPTINLGAVLTNRIADNAITSLKILDGAIITSKIADAAINSLKLLDGAVTSAKIQDATIATVDILDGAISTLKIADNGVTTTKILDGAITSAKVLDASLATADLADGAITSVKVLDGAITSAKVFDGTLATADLADGAITSVKVLDGAITSAKVLDASLATADLADGAITSPKVLDGAITSAKVLDGAIVNADINAAAGIAITKFAAGTAGQILLTLGTTPTWSGIGGDLTGTFPNPTIATGAGNSLVTALNNAATTLTISTAKLNTSVVLDTESPASGDVSGSFNGGIQINANAVSTSEIQDGGIGTIDIANSAITDAKIASGIDITKLTASSSNGFVLTSVLGNVTWAALPVLGLGTVTSVDTGPSLTGGPILTSGTIDLANNGVTTVKVLDDAITSAKLRDDPTTDVNRAVTTNHIRDGAVNSAKILDATIATADLADGAVSSLKITDATIATADLADGAVSSIKITDASIVNADVSPTAAIAVTKLAAGATGNVLTTPASGIPTWQAPVDASATNEIQTLSITGTTLSISSGNSVTIPGSSAQDLGSVLSVGGDAKGGDAYDLKSVSINTGTAPGPGALNVNGSQYVSFTPISDIYDVKPDDYLLLAVQTSKPATVNLPKASANKGRVLIIRSMGRGPTEKCVVKSTEAIDGFPTSEDLYYVSDIAYSITVISDGVEWFTINRAVTPPGKG